MSGMFRSSTTICTGSMPSTSIARRPEPASTNVDVVQRTERGTDHSSNRRRVVNNEDGVHQT